VTQWRYERYRDAYLEMAKRAKYRPEAPGDGFGNIYEGVDLADPAVLADEARRYGKRFLAEDDAMDYPLGCPDGPGNQAFCYIIEAARALCSGEAALANVLLKMAMEAIAAEYPSDRLRVR
jgi:hypothetical protein